MSLSVKDRLRIERMYSVNYKRYLPPHSDARIMDLGSGGGECLDWLHDLGYLNVSGVDSDPAKAARSDVVHGEILMYVGVMDDKSVDIFMMNNVIEHLPKQYALSLLQEIVRVLRPGGRLIVKTGNMENPFNLALFARDLTHETFWTKRSLMRAMRDSGFSEVEVRGVHPGYTWLNWPLIWLSKLMGLALVIIARLLMVRIEEPSALIYCIATKE